MAKNTVPISALPDIAPLCEDKSCYESCYGIEESSWASEQARSKKNSTKELRQYSTPREEAWGGKAHFLDIGDKPVLRPPSAITRQFATVWILDKAT